MRLRVRASFLSALLKVVRFHDDRPVSTPRGSLVAWACGDLESCPVPCIAVLGQRHGPHVCTRTKCINRRCLKGDVVSFGTVTSYVSNWPLGDRLPSGRVLSPFLMSQSAGDCKPLATHHPYAHGPGSPI